MKCILQYNYNVIILPVGICIMVALIACPAPRPTLHLPHPRPPRFIPTNRLTDRLN